MRASIILIGMLTAAFLVVHAGRATADSACSDSCQKAYAACANSCKKQNTNCFTKCINEQQSCLVRCG